LISVWFFLFVFALVIGVLVATLLWLLLRSSLLRPPILLWTLAAFGPA
jgi:hypothetical protein